MKVYNNSQQNFGMAYHVDKKAGSTLLSRLSTPAKYIKYDDYKRAITKSSAQVNITAGQGVSPRRLQATIYNKNGEFYKHLHEGFLESIVFSPNHFMKKLLNIVDALDKV